MQVKDTIFNIWNRFWSLHSNYENVSTNYVIKVIKDIFPSASAISNHAIEPLLFKDCLTKFTSGRELEWLSPVMDKRDEEFRKRNVSLACRGVEGWSLPLRCARMSCGSCSRLKKVRGKAGFIPCHFGGEKCGSMNCTLYITSCEMTVCARVCLC